MYADLSDSYKKAAATINADRIPVGDVIQHLRDNTAEFDVKNGGMFLTRDGFHLSTLYGRYAAALTWYSKLTARRPHTAKFIPECAGQKGDERIIEVIKDAVATVLKK